MPEEVTKPSRPTPTVLPNAPKLQPPGETVYIFGAGVNRGIFDQFGVNPPLMRNVFITLNRLGHLKGVRWAQDSWAHFDEAFRFVQEEFKIDESQLFNTEINWESCLDRATERREQATTDAERQRFFSIQVRLIQILACTLSTLRFEGVFSEIMRALGEIIWEEQATVITFNYDTYVEEVLTSASNLGWDSGWTSDWAKKWRSDYQSWVEGGWKGPPPPTVLDYRRDRWTRELGYGVPFDKLEIIQPNNMPRRVDGAAFYGHPGNQFHEVKVLKLHGSLDWFRYSNVPQIVGHGVGPPDSSLFGQSLLRDYLWQPDDWPSDNNIILEPLIVAGADKSGLLKQEPFKEVWRLAKDALTHCSRVVIIGYSFPDEDPDSRELVRESLKQRTKSLSVEWVLPSTTHVLALAEELGLPAQPWHRRTVEQYVLRHPSIRSRWMVSDLIVPRR